MTSRGSIFPTFFLSRFECSTFVWKDQGRRDLCEETQHRVHADEDCRFLAGLGIAVAREGIPWPMIDRGGGNYDFSYLDPFTEAQRRHRSSRSGTCATMAIPTAWILSPTPLSSGSPPMPKPPPAM